jgi:hypothetical protein
MVDLIESRDAQAARAFTRRLMTAFDRGLLSRLATLTSVAPPPLPSSQFQGDDVDRAALARPTTEPTIDIEDEHR